jgi:hypothetical protein
MEDIMKLYNNIMNLESDMLLNPDRYSDNQLKEKCYEAIRQTEAVLYENGFVIDTDGILKRIDKK